MQKKEFCEPAEKAARQDSRSQSRCVEKKIPVLHPAGRVDRFGSQSNVSRTGLSSRQLHNPRRSEIKFGTIRGEVKVIYSKQKKFYKSHALMRLAARYHFTNVTSQKSFGRNARNRLHMGDSADDRHKLPVSAIQTLARSQFRFSTISSNEKQQVKPSVLTATSY